MVVTLRESDHTYHDETGRVIPGVTSLLKPLFGFEWINEQVLERKSKLGTAVHFATELHDKGEDLTEYDFHIDTIPYIDAYMTFMNEVKPTWDGIEELVVNQKLGYAGTLDRRGVMYDKPTLLDIKCVAQVSPGAFVQDSAYLEAVCPGNTLDYKRFVLQLKPDGQYRLYEPKSTHREDFGVFVSCLTQFRWKERYAN